MLHGVRVLTAHLLRACVGATKHNWAVVLAARHLANLRRVIEDLVKRNRAEIPSHKLDNRTKSDHRGAHAQSREAALGDRRIDHALGPELLEHALADLVGAVVVADLFAHEKDRAVSLHLFNHGLAQGLAVSERSHDVLVQLAKGPS